MFPIKSLSVALLLLTCCALPAQAEEHRVYISRPKEVAALIEKAAMTKLPTPQ